MVLAMVQTRYDPQGLLIQLETALHRLAESFWDQPYRFFTEADAVAGLERWVASRPELAQTYGTADDGLETGLLHREYPTFFRLRDQQPTQRLSTGGARGHYDLVLLNPAYVQNRKAEALTNRSLREREEFPAPPLLAVVEFKLFPDGWNKTRVKDVQNELGKLRLSLEEPDTETAYLCILQRDVSGRKNRWEQHWPQVEAELKVHSEVRSLVAVCWPSQEREPFVGYSGSWQTTLPGW